MPLFHREKPIEYDRTRMSPAVRKSICTGEMTLGFIERDTNRFIDYGKARDQADLEAFCRRAGIDEKDLVTIY